MGKINRRYSKSFKEKAVSLSYGRENIKELADELGVQVQRIYKWRRAAKPGILTKKTLSTIKNESLEVKQLKKDLKNAQLELEILKKAVHIFSKSDGKSINLS
ncbi:MAG: transposase [Flavobacteriaceae bacterium]|nr:transposase [Flavobacteriaceae bacterium]